MKTIALDTETVYSTQYSLKGMIAEEYTSDPRFDCYMLSVYDGAEAWAGHPKNFDWSMLDGARVVMHNAYFDTTVLRELVKRGLAPEPNIKEIVCSADLSSWYCNCRSLAQAVEFTFGKHLSKQVRSNAKGKSWDDFSAEEQKSMLEYARGDATWTWKLWDKLSPGWPQFERDLSQLTRDQGQRGVQIDTEKLDRYITLCHRALEATKKTLPWVDDGKAPSSAQAVAWHCRRIGIPGPPVKSDDAEGYGAWEAIYAPQYSWVTSVSSYRSLTKLASTFESMKARWRSDDTMPFALKYFGAHCFTGEHEVLTERGWERLDQWTGGKIMQRFPDKTLDFAEAVPNQFSAEGETLLRFKNSRAEFVVTPGHWVACIDKKQTLIKRQAGELFQKKCRFKLPLAGTKTTGAIELPDWKIQLLVAVQADAHYMTDCRSIRFRLKRSRKVERLRDILSVSGLDWKETSYPAEPDVSVFIIRQFPDWLDDGKVFGVGMLGWSLETRRIFIEELVHWDGYQCGPGSVEYATTNKNNAEWVVTLAHITGHSAHVSTASLREEGWADLYRVFLRKDVDTCVDGSTCWSEELAPEKVFCPTSKTGVCLFRYRGTVFLSGQTGRWSGDANLNFQNPRKESVWLNEQDLMETDEARLENSDRSWATGEINFRHLILPRPGKKMIISDLSQIEPRVLAWIAGDKEFLKLVAKGISPYEAFAQVAYGYSGTTSLKKSDPGKYALMKVQVLGLGYGCGWKKFITVAKTMAGLDLSEEDSRKIVAEYRECNPGITALWARLDDGFRKSFGNDFVMTLPSGRQMKYRKIRRDIRMVPDPTDPEKMIGKYVWSADIGNKRESYYGGKLCENLVQATARDVFATQLLELHRTPGITTLFSCHDEAVLECDESVTAKDVEGIMSKTPEWLPGCPVAAEAKEVKHYEK